MLLQARPQALLALAPHAIMLVYLRSPEFLHWLFCWLWGNILDPMHSLHCLLWRLRSHMLDPPHSLHSPQALLAIVGTDARPQIRSHEDFSSTEIVRR